MFTPRLGHRRPARPAAAMGGLAFLMAVSIGAGPAAAELKTDIEYGRAGETPLLLDAHVPDGAGPFPVAILVHGGGWGSGDKRGAEKANSGADITPWFAPLSEGGFTWFSINYRLAPAHRWPACFEDVQTAIRWVKAHAAEYKGDPGRIAILGHSAGGHLAFLAAALAGDDTRVQAVVGYAPVTDFEQELPRRGGISLALRNLHGLAGQPTPYALGILRETAPITHVRPGLPPFLILHGDADKTVPLQQSLNFLDRLRANGVPSDVFIISGAPHRLTEWHKFDAMHPARMLAWLRTKLGPATDAATFFVAPDGRDTNPGTRERPWATLQHAARTLAAGQTVTVRGGLYRIAEQIRPAHSGRAGAWITYCAAAGEQPVIDASDIPVDRMSGGPVSPLDQGAFQIEGVSYVRVKGLKIQSSHAAGFTVRDASHVELLNNTTENTFSSGIAVWDTNHDGLDCEYHRILGNTIIHATTFAMALPPHRGFSEPPHEAISIAGSQHFEVAWNHIYDSDKEGIDVKETSKHGRVHHNFVHDVDRQGLYVDAWFGRIEDVELDHNVATRCDGAGLVFSVENGESVENVRAHHNLLVDNLGSGIFFSRWGDGPRRRLSVYNNTAVHNGYGAPAPGQAFFWLTGGVFLYSTNLLDVDLRNNLVSDNRGFQIGYSQHYRELGDPDAAMAARRIVLDYNLTDDRNDLTYPISVGWAPNDFTSAWALAGGHAVSGRASFVNASAMDLRPATGSPAIDAGDPRPEYDDADGTRGDVGAFAAGGTADLWWTRDFPPSFELD